MKTSRRFPVVLVAGCLMLIACGEEVAVYQQTRVYPDGSVWRALQIYGRDADGEVPEKADWLRRGVGVALADPDAWVGTEEDAGYLAADGQFLSAADLPASLAHQTDVFPEGSGSVSVPDRQHVELRRDDLVVLQRWSYGEHVADPFGSTDLAAALDELEQLAVEALVDEVRRDFDDPLDGKRAADFVHDRARALADDLFATLKRIPGDDPQGERVRLLDALLRRYGVPAVDVSNAEDWGEALTILLDPLLDWSRAGVARALTIPDRPVTPEQLAFWPTMEELESWYDESDENPPGPRRERLARISFSLLRSITGYYGDDGSPDHRFLCTLELPGRLLRTNGTPDDRGVVHWIFRSEEVAAGLEMQAESVELDIETLIRLGARRDFDTETLLRLVDLLTARDPRLVQRLADAAAAGDLDTLMDVEDPGNELRELYELLDPQLEPWPAR